MKMTRVGSMILAVALVLVVVVGCAPKPAEEGKHEIVTLEFYCSPAGTPLYSQGLVIAEMLKELHPWLRATTLESLGGGDAIFTSAALSPARKKHTLLLTAGNNITLAEAHLGIGAFKKKYPALKVFCSHGISGVAVATYNPEIRTPQDLVGRRVGIPPRGSPLAILGEALLRDAWGILDKVKVSEHRPFDFKDVLVSGVVDAAILTAGSNFAEGDFFLPGYVLQVTGAKKTYWLNATPEDAERINQKNPWEPSLLIAPKGAYGEGNPLEDLGVVAFVGAWICWPEFDEEIAYELLGFLYDNAEEYTRRLPGQEPGYGLPFYPGLTEEMVHPGALRYYKEKGVKLGLG